MSQKPKTNYTYAETASYMKYSPTKGYQNPNMARKTLRGKEAMVSQSKVRSRATTSRRSDVFTTSGSNVINLQESLSTLDGVSMEVHDGETVESVALGSIPGSNRLQVDHGEHSENDKSFSAGVTRSGLKYSVNQRLMQERQTQQALDNRRLTRQLDFDTTDLAQNSLHAENDQAMSPEYRSYEKRMEYAGESIPYKEAMSPVPHLFGLDNAEHSDDSEFEDDFTSVSSRTSIFLQTITVLRAAWSSVTSGLYRTASSITTTTIHMLKSFLTLIAYCMAAVGYLGHSGWSITKSKSRSLLSYIILADVWILSRCRKCGLCLFLPLILLIPFLLCGGYYMYDQGSEAVIGASLDNVFGSEVVKQPAPASPSSTEHSDDGGWGPLLLLGSIFGSGGGESSSSRKQTEDSSDSSFFTGWFGGGSEDSGKGGASGVDSSKDTVIVENSGSDTGQVSGATTPGAGGLYLNEAELQAKIRQVFIAMYGEQESKSQQETVLSTQQILIQQDQIFNQYKVDVEAMTKNIVKEELGAFAAGAGHQRNEDVGKIGTLAQEQVDQALKMKAIQDQMTTVLGRSDDLSTQILAAKDKMKVQDEASKGETLVMIGDLEKKLEGLQSDIAALQIAQTSLAGQLKECCKNDSTLALLIRAGVRDELSGFMSGAMAGGAGDNYAAENGDRQNSGSAFNLWLQNQFATRADIEDRIATLAAKLNEQIRKSVAESATATDAAIAAAMHAAAGNEAGGKSKDEDSIGVGIGAGVSSDNENVTKSGSGMGGIYTSTLSDSSTIITSGNFTGLTEQQVKLLIREALYIFGADKTGMVDYALESAGGSVISTRCSETYHRRTAQLSLFGIPLWYASNSPRTVIQPDVHPGQCWAFKGSHGYLVILLAGLVKPTAFSLEHIPKSLSPTGKIDSAPKDFSIRGLEHEKDTEGYDLGTYQYDQDGEPLQYFNVKDPGVKGFPIMELTIESNWGNEEYTCLYRFRVHGQLHKWTGDS